MENDLMQLKVADFLAVLASDAPAPGGGSVAALNLALGAALVEMVTALTIGKKRYAEVEERMLTLQAKAGSLRKTAEQLAEDDTAAYSAVIAAYGLPRATDEEKEARKEAIQDATRTAIKVPLDTARQCLSLGELAEEALHYGNSNAYSDAVVAFYQAEAACRSALENVRINLNVLASEDEVEKYKSEIVQVEEAIKKQSVVMALQVKARS